MFYTASARQLQRKEVPSKLHIRSPPAMGCRAEQGIGRDDQRLTFHHTPQGTRCVPYDWFMALEQPCLSLFGCELLADKTYLARSVFCPARPTRSSIPMDCRLASRVRKTFMIQTTGRPIQSWTNLRSLPHGELHYGKYAVRVDGAPAMIEVTEFQKALLLSVGFTQKIPFRYGRFESE